VAVASLLTWRKHRNVYSLTAPNGVTVETGSSQD
jgi:hypothetical protein